MTKERVARVLRQAQQQMSRINSPEQPSRYERHGDQFTIVAPKQVTISVPAGRVSISGEAPTVIVRPKKRP